MEIEGKLNVIRWICREKRVVRVVVRGETSLEISRGTVGNRPSP